MTRVIAVLLVTSGIAAQMGLTRYDRVLNLEEASEDSANVSIGDLDGDGDLDLALSKGRHTPLVDRILLNDSKGNFSASDLGAADRTYSAVLADQLQMRRVAVSFIAFWLSKSHFAISVPSR